MAEMLAETSLPPGAFSVLPCSRAAGNVLVEDDRIKVLSFTGSPAVRRDADGPHLGGRRRAHAAAVRLDGTRAALPVWHDPVMQVGYDLMSKAGKKRCVLELGGNAACIVDRDANIPETVDRLLFGAFYQSGQSCIRSVARRRPLPFHNPPDA